MKKYRKISARSSSTPDSGTKLIADLHGIAASQAFWEKGVRLATRIERCSLIDGLVSILRPAALLPFGVHAWHAVRQAGFINLSSDWPRLFSPMQRHPEGEMVITLPPLWRGQIKEESYLAFCQLTGEEFVHLLAQELNDPYLKETMSNEDDIFKALGCRWIGFYPPVLFSYVNFRMDAGTARSIDLKSTTIPRYSRKSRKEVEMDHVEQALAWVLGQLRRHRGQLKKRDVDLMLAQVEHRFSFAPEDARWRVLKLLLYRTTLHKINERYPHRRRGARKRQLTSIERLTGRIGEVGRLIEAVRAGDERGEIQIDRPQRAVLTHFIEVLNEEELSEDEISLFRVPSFVPGRKFDLRQPVVYRDYFGLGAPTFDPRKRLAAAAKRILACFPHYCGRRAACVVLMTIGDLALGCNPKALEQFAAYCRYTKNRSQRNGWHPIAYLWPETELTFARAFLIACREAGLPGSLQLMQVAGLGQRTEEGRNVAYSKHTVDLAQLRLRDGLVPGCRLSTHLGRFAFASYWQLRVLAITYPFLRSTPFYVQLQSHFWFQDEGLEKLGQLLQQVPYHNSLAAASIMGLSSPDQFNSTYHRGQPLELMAWQEVLRAKSLVEMGPSSSPSLPA